VPPRVDAVDPFDLPDWLGTSDVAWVARSSVRGAHRVAGDLEADDQALPCDLLAADVAFPEALLEEGWRRAAHQAWTHGQVLLVAYDGRLTLPVPGTAYSADGVLEAVGRLAKALGVRPDRFSVTLRL